MQQEKSGLFNASMLFLKILLMSSSSEFSFNVFSFKFMHDEACESQMRKLIDHAKGQFETE
jgi:hypothetical protein